MTTRIKLTGNQMQGQAPASEDTPDNVEKVCIAPSWTDTARMLCMVMRDGTPQGKANAEAEIIRMGQMLDKVKAAQDAAKTD